MKINQVKELDDGVSGITIEGKIIKTPKPPNNGEYGWSQMIVLKDDTGEIGSWISIENPENAYKVGQNVKLQGKVSKYMKGDKLGISINGKVIEEVVNDKDVSQEENKPKETSDYGAKDNYWEKKFKYEVQRDPKVQLAIARQCAIKAVTELASSASKVLPLKTEKDYFESADKIVSYIYKDIDLMVDESVALLGGETHEETKEERIEKASKAVGETRFRPASTLQKNKIFGYRDEEGWHKGIIESRFITKEEIREIGDPAKLSVEEASKWLGFWWGEGEEIGERAKREIEAKDKEPLVKGDKTSLTKDIVIDEINALRRENFLIDDEKFEKEMGCSSKLEELSEKDLAVIKGLLKTYNPDWTKEED